MAKDRAPATDALRQRPIQPRARARIESLLDAAAEVFDEVGYQAATTSEVVERAGVSPGTLYRWFPDKQALADALADRYLQTLAGLYDGLLTNDPDEPAPDLIRRALDALSEFAADHPALGALVSAALSPSDPNPGGQRLRADLHEKLALLIELRVPDIAPTDRDRVAMVVLNVALNHQATVAATPKRDVARVTDEYVDLLVAYLDAKFPAPDDPVWADAAARVRPLAASPQIPRPAPDAAS